MDGFLQSTIKNQCYGCEACIQGCPMAAIHMEADLEGFRYPTIDQELCIHCGLCHQVCPKENPPVLNDDPKYTYGGYYNDWNIRDQSTSGGAFTAIAETWCDNNYIIFGAVAKGLDVFHSYVFDIKEIDQFRKSKYSQSRIGTAYKDVSRFLKDGKKVLFSGTPCQIAGLKSFLGRQDINRLLTVEVVCEGVPSPLFMELKDQYLVKRYGAHIESIDYRYTDTKLENPTGRWDFQVMYTQLQNGKILKQDRWFNPYWTFWLSHLMSRPSCYECSFTTTARGADITLGDLWGVHLFCPELYGHNGGASLIICNTKKGISAFCQAKTKMHGHTLDFQTALKYQSPLRKCIAKNNQRQSFINDLQKLSYTQLCEKWYSGPSLKVLWQKYIWGNRQKIFVWNLFYNMKGKG